MADDTTVPGVPAVTLVKTVRHDELNQPLHPAAFGVGMWSAASQMSLPSATLVARK